MSVKRIVLGMCLMAILGTTSSQAQITVRGRLAHDLDAMPGQMVSGEVTVDNETDQLVWRGVATETISSKPEKNEKRFKSAIGKLFKKYPPKKKK